ncbi:spermatogenesis-associated protein 20 isoform X2 [Phlebotomus argentipes]|nr:spermatogenesis-associated protein 20 isoform X2 [Phlebotomus argentipes]
MATSGEHTNRLINEKSPYLLQHAHNPVDWYPFGQEAIERAKRENKLIFLSVGYSTCHWCHVMEKESFEDETIAKVMNDNFVNVKVDREERPDVDRIYMSFIQMTSGGGGWPMSVWITPELRPIMAGTYFPPVDRWGQPGFRTILQRMADKWRRDSGELEGFSSSVVAAMQESLKMAENTSDDLAIEEKFKECTKIYKGRFDGVWGGFGHSPKFPEVSRLNFLLHAFLHAKIFLGKTDEDIFHSVSYTLEKICHGGIHDHVFGGFSRYSVDQKWHVPHFEKMLYDQAQLMTILCNSYRMRPRKLFLDVVDRVFEYMCSDLRESRGAFFSGEDADSFPTHASPEKIEGAFYAWLQSEIEEAFEENAGKLAEFSFNALEVFLHHYSAKEEGNVDHRSDPHGHLQSKNILMITGSVQKTAEHFKISVEELQKMLSIANEFLHGIRNKRPRPHLDVKMVCSWNGLVLTGLSKLASLKESSVQEDCGKVAGELFKFIQENFFDHEAGKLKRVCYSPSEQSTSNAPIYGFLDDYAFMIRGLLDYYEFSLREDVLLFAKDLQDIQDKLFWDAEKGGYFYTEANSDNLIVRMKEDYDGAEPSGNSMSVKNLLLLGGYFDSSDYRDKAKNTLKHFSAMSHFGYALPEMMSSALIHDTGVNEIVIVGPDNEASMEFVKVIREFYIPGLTIFRVNTDSAKEFAKIKKDTHKMLNNLPTVHICFNQTCLPPETSVDNVRRILAEKYTSRN